MGVVRSSRFAKHVLRPCALALALSPILAVQAWDGTDPPARFEIPQQTLSAALSDYARQSGKQLLYSPDLATGRTGRAVVGSKAPTRALEELLEGTGLTYTISPSGAILIMDPAQAGRDAAAKKDKPGGPQGNGQEVAALQSATTSGTVAQQTASEAATRTAEGRRETTLDTLVVTAQKKVENIQKVPIAISAFSGDDLNDRKIETGGDLVTATPNVTFSKTNFASYNFQIRGIGTQALSVTTDPAVAVSFNSTPMIRNRLFEQEYLDVERVEVLRGPQGTLYGRNATAGVVNMIPNLADPEGFDASVKAELGNYESRRVNAMVNVPLSETFAFRVAAQYTRRDGYDHNTVTGKDVNDRDLLTTRLSATFRPSERLNASLVWEHFREDDMRARTGKQICHNDPGPATIEGYVPEFGNARNYLSQSCADGSLYGNDAFGVPNAASLPYILGASAAGLGLQVDENGFPVAALPLLPPGVDPYAGLKQSTDLRSIATTYDPRFEAKNDIVQLNFDFDISDRLKLVSQTLYTRDRYYSTQDYGRFQSNPIFNDSNDAIQFLPDGTIAPAYPATPGGVYCDPQLGCSDRLLNVDLVDSYSTQWSQEFRLQSAFDGMFNFSLGANYLEYEIDESYYVFNNVFSALSQFFFNGNGAGTAPGDCPAGTATRMDPNQGIEVPCVYVDPNPLRAIDGQGHNYFRSRNVAKTRSAALFGEGYWQLSDTLRLTAGLRVTRDRKVTTPYPSQTMLADSTNGANPLFGGYVGYGYPAGADIRQTWTEPTGRLVLDWSPDLSFTDSTLIYASVSRGYKAGGTNSPGVGANPEALSFEQRNPRFRPEYVNAFEIGTKNVMAGGQLMFNATAFYNDYKDYQVSQIQDRATLNENFDARTWGAEFELVWRPTDAFQLSGNVGLLRSRIGSNQYSIDVMDRTAGNPGWTTIRPWMQLASNCIAPTELVATALENYFADPFNQMFSNAGFLNSFCTLNYYTATGGFTADKGFGGGPGTYAYLLNGAYYDPTTDAPNGGAGFAKNVGGNELPNAPHITVSLSPQYTFMLADSELTLRADLYYQGKSWARIYQDRIDRLREWGNVNLSLTWYKPATDLTVQLYVKNALDEEAITGTFLNSDDTGLTSNVFIQDPRIIGLSIRKGFF